MTGNASRTAAFVAFFRALETAGPRSRRLFEDPLAQAMLPATLGMAARIARLPISRTVLTRFVDVRWPRTRSSAVVRTRLIDDLVRASLADGARQLLILGAGFDTRPYRLPELATVTAFEVDHPATRARKRTRLPARALHGAREVRFVAVDFEVDDLAGALLAAGFDVSTRCIVIWEGVLSYLTSASVDQTFATLQRLMSADGSLIFTYVHRGAIDGSVEFAEAKRWKAVVRASGEPFVFGFEPSELATYLRRYGFTLVSDTSTSDAAQRYNECFGRNELGSELYRVAVAKRTEP